MPTLDWIGKDAVVKHHKDVPYRLLEPMAELCCGDTASGNLIVYEHPSLRTRLRAFSLFVALVHARVVGSQRTLRQIMQSPGAPSAGGTRQCLN